MLLCWVLFLKNCGKKKHNMFMRIFNTGVKENEIESDIGLDSILELKE